ncbi:MAG: hypothetical protein JSR71_09410 [Proteobacteria bacterium]|nr:hypothetical protein [Pseudomonadota bacterium]
MTQKLKEKIEDAFQNIKDVNAQQTFGYVTEEINAAIDGAKAAVHEHIDDFQRANSAADMVSDVLLERARKSAYSTLYIVFLFLGGVAAGYGIHYLF